MASRTAPLLRDGAGSSMRFSGPPASSVASSESRRMIRQRKLEKLLRGRTYHMVFFRPCSPVTWRSMLCSTRLYLEGTLRYSSIGEVGPKSRCSDLPIELCSMLRPSGDRGDRRRPFTPWPPLYAASPIPSLHRG